MTNLGQYEHCFRSISEHHKTRAGGEGGGEQQQQGEKKAEHSSILFKKNTLSFLLSMPRWPSITKKSSIIYCNLKYFLCSVVQLPSFFETNLEPTPSSYTGDLSFKSAEAVGADGLQKWGWATQRDLGTHVPSKWMKGKPPVCFENLNYCSELKFSDKSPHYSSVQ